MSEHHGHKKHPHGHSHGEGHGHDHLGNPEDLQNYLERLESADRAGWQQPDAVVTALGLREGAQVCEVGAGPGYFTLRLARAVGARGRVFAIDAEPRMLDVLRQRLAQGHVQNVEPILATDSATLPPAPVDLVLIVNTFHHFPNGVEYLRALATRLAPNGVIVNIDLQAGELPIGPPPEHKVSRENFIAAARSAGLQVAREETFLPYQYFIFLKPAA